MKAFLKRLGRSFVSLKQENEDSVKQKVLLVDGSLILQNNFALIVKGVREKFKNANLQVLTFEDKKDFLKDNFSDIKIVAPEKGIRMRRYALAIQLFGLLRQRPSFVILSSLDVSTLTAALLFAGCPVLLHNRWLQWYRLRQRTLSDVFKARKSADKDRRIKSRGFREAVKTIGRMFVILLGVNEADTGLRILIEDNGYTDIGHVSSAVSKAQRLFINPDITILTSASRRGYFEASFSNTKFAVAKEAEKFGLTRLMCRLRRRVFDYIILTALDISAVAVALLFMKSNVLLYNRWHQWWRLRLKDAGGYFRLAALSLISLPAYLYLFVSAPLILLRKSVRMMMEAKPGNLKK